MGSFCVWQLTLTSDLIMKDLGFAVLWLDQQKGFPLDHVSCVAKLGIQIYQISLQLFLYISLVNRQIYLSQYFFSLFAEMRICRPLL